MSNNDHTEPILDQYNMVQIGESRLSNACLADEEISPRTISEGEICIHFLTNRSDDYTEKLSLSNIDKFVNLIEHIPKNKFSETSKRSYHGSIRTVKVEKENTHCLICRRTHNKVQNVIELGTRAWLHYSCRDALIKILNNLDQHSDKIVANNL